MKKLAAIATSCALAITLSSCSSSINQHQGTESTTAEQSVNDISGNLTKQVEFSGVNMSVDPSWKSEQKQDSIRFDASSSVVVSVRTFMDGETKSLDSFKQINGVEKGSYESLKSWESNGISYNEITTTNSFGDTRSYLYGSNADGIGFYVYFGMDKKATTDNNVAIRDAVFDTVQFNAEKVTVSSTEVLKQSQQNSTSNKSQSNALKMAKQYLSTMPFSHDSLVKQLEYEGFSNEDATYAADNCGADWNSQAAKAAQSYLDIQAFSRQRLIEQLEYEGYTEEQATYGVDSVGL